MEKRNRGFAILLLIAGIFGLMALALPAPQIRAASLSSSDDLSDDDAGAWIELYVLLGAWQEPWTVVQWQDNLGAWNDVYGWRGEFDAIQNGVGKNSWWVGQEYFGEGPFRWIVYEKNTGVILAQSESFFLPTEINQTVIIEVAP